MVGYIIGWLLPIIYATGCLLAFSKSGCLWRGAKVTAVSALVVMLVAVATALVTGQFVAISVDRLGLTMALLVALLGWVIINYSARYLAGEPEQARFVRAMLFTLTAVCILVVSSNLLIIVLAWSATSLGLHHLLTFYRERKAAQIVAHKKFLVSRLADVVLAIALVLIYQTTGSLWLHDLKIFLAAAEPLPLTLHVSALLFALAAILKTAQLPLHGWLIQVMEAPTPVSALLHAGVVNMGGFILIRLADLITLVPAAQALLLVVGSLTAVLAGLVMLTRISIKVRLAWSTCAQMGFMLMEIGLGLYELALLHLVAHSLYKAYAFLSAGETVTQARRNDFFSGTLGKREPWWYLGAVLVSVALVFGSAAVWQLLLPAMSLPLVALLIVSFGLAPLLWAEQGASPALLLRSFVQVIGLTQLYLLWHLLFAGVAPAAATASTLAVIWVVSCFALLYVMQVWLRCFPQGRFARGFYPWAYCGFYLDETFTRLTFKLWPVRFSALQARTLVNRNPTFKGEQQ